MRLLLACVAASLMGAIAPPPVSAALKPPAPGFFEVEDMEGALYFGSLRPGQAEGALEVVADWGENTLLLCRVARIQLERHRAPPGRARRGSALPAAELRGLGQGQRGADASASTGQPATEGAQENDWGVSLTLGYSF